MAFNPKAVPEIHVAIDAVTRNELVLGLIFKELEIQELKICRHVCSKWNPLAFKEIRAKNWTERNILIDNECGRRHRFEAYFNQFHQIPEYIPYSCYKFKNEYRDGGESLLGKFCETFKKQIKGICIESSVCAQKILDICGESLIEIGITAYKQRNKYPSELKIKNSYKNPILLPNLKTISLLASLPTRAKKDNMLSDLHKVFKNILSNMRPNSLEEFNFNNWGKFDLLVGHMIEMNQVNNLQRLVLYIGSNFEKGDLLIFKKRGVNLRLKQLKIYHEDPTATTRDYGRATPIETDPEELHEFLATQKKSLQDLDLVCSIYSFPPDMIGLKTLKIRVHGNVLTRSTFTPTINFAESLPNLMNLDLWLIQHIFPSTHNWDRDQLIFSEHEICISLQKLTLPVYFTMSVGVLGGILRTFPRLSTLELKPISSEVFLLIWNSDELSDTLNVLTLWIGSNGKRGPVYMPNSLQMDQIFSGVSQEESTILTPEEYSKKFNLDELQDNSILKLKNLRKLHLNWILGNQLHLLSDFAGICVFGKMKNLTDLFIHQNIHRFSAYCIARLKNINQNFVFEQQGNEGTPSNSQYLRTMMIKHEMHPYG